MRLARLDLTRYGHFTDHRIDLGPAVAGRPDIHVVYGPNEAGKSTAASAFVDLLFGIEARSPYHFLHDYPMMRIGAVLESAGASRAIVRVKRNQGSLLDGMNRPIDEAPIVAALSGLDRGAFRSAFSIDEETLEAGGEGILASRGELGRLLFAASAGLSNVSQVIARARADAEAFYKARARSGELARLKSRLSELKLERETVDTLASRHASLVATRDAVSGRYEDALSARGTTVARIEALGTVLRGLPLATGLRTLRRQIAELSGIPEAPAAWHSVLPELQVRSVEVATRLAVLDGTIERLSLEIEAILVDHDVLALAGEVEALVALRARCSTAEADLPDRRAQLRVADRLVDELAYGLGRPAGAAPGSSILDAPTSAALRDLIERRSGIDANLRAARGEVAEARSSVAEARLALDVARGSRRDVSARSLAQLSEVIVAARDNDHVARSRLARRDHAKALLELDEAMSGVRPWSGGPDDLVGMHVPTDEDVELWKVRWRDAGNAIASAAHALSRADRDRVRFEAELDASAIASGLPTEEEAASVRARRERAWADHRRALDPVTADEFESAMRREDTLVAVRVNRAGDLARLRSAHEGQTLAIAAAREAASAATAGTTELASVKAEMSTACARMGVSFGEPEPTRLQAWLSRRSVAIERCRRVKDAASELDLAERDGRHQRDRLLEALGAAGAEVDATAGFEAALAHAVSVLAEASALVAVQAQVSERETDFARRERALEGVEAEDGEWRSAWDELCSRCWLGEGGRRRSVAEVRAVLDVLEKLGPALHRCASLVDQVDRMTGDLDLLGSKVAAFAGRLGSLDLSGTPVEVATCLEEVVTRAEANAARVAERRIEIQGASAERQRVADQAAASAELGREMLAFFGVATLNEVQERLRQLAHRAELIRQADGTERQIIVTLGVGTVAEAEMLLDGADRRATEVELNEARLRLEGLDLQVRDAFASLTLARQALDAIGGDAAAAAITERRRTTILEVLDGATRHLRLMTGAMAAEHAIRLYRERHRSTMMMAAGEAFSALTCNAYTRLDSRLDREGEKLVAIASNGASRTADTLSKGTRFQLYLALRVAAHAEFMRFHSPLPFIVDDAFETFDDRRAEQAFLTLSRMAVAGQVLVFTHHAHLCRIATDACPGVHIHELPPAPHAPSPRRFGC